MSLREQLRKLLPDILPVDSKDAIKGTELIQLVKYRLKQDYSDATLRYHFSIMSCDPSAPIAKVEHGQGYYLRTNTLTAMSSARHLLSARQATFGDESDRDSTQALFRANKFRALVARYYESEQRFPFVLSKTFDELAEYGELWKYPDMAIIDWEVGVAEEGGIRFDQDMIQLKRSFGSQPFTLRSMKMKLEIGRETFREDFFQCLSNSRWAHFGEFIIATAIDDDKLIDELRTLGAEFGIGITSFGLSADDIDSLPEPGAIQSFNAAEVAAMSKRINLQRISAPRPRKELDWNQIRTLRKENQELEEMFHWITYSLDHGMAQSYETYRSSEVTRIANGEAVDVNEAALRHAERLVSGLHQEQNS